MDFNPQKENKERQMKVQAINTNNYQQNKPNFKAYIKPNANFHILYGKEASFMAETQRKMFGANFGVLAPFLVKRFSELPKHCLEILKINKINQEFVKEYTKITQVEDNIMDVFECIVLNHETKRTANIRLEPSFAPLTQLMEGIVEKENTAFFKGELLERDKAFYNTLTTGEPLDEMYIEAMNKYKG